MPRLSSRLGHIASEVKEFVGDRVSIAHIRAVTTQLADMVFPPHGLAGEADDTGSIGMEAALWSKIRFLEGDGCEMCARPFDSGLHFGHGALCQTCSDAPFPFSRTRAACIYGEASKGVILAFKHGDRLDAAPMLTRWLERAAADVLDEADIIVPVPLHWQRLWSRRYNQAAELARPLAKRFGKSFLADDLRRIQVTKQQGHASAQVRWDNVKNAFRVTPGGVKRIAGKRVVLVDDVFTTGATLKACARELLKAGAVQVDVAVLARAIRETL